jgi:hypothetical protein
MLVEGDGEQPLGDLRVRPGENRPDEHGQRGRISLRRCRRVVSAQGFRFPARICSVAST